MNKKTYYLLFEVKPKFIKNCIDKKNKRWKISEYKYPLFAYICGIDEKNVSKIKRYFKRYCKNYELQSEGSEIKTRQSGMFKLGYLYDNASIQANIKNLDKYSANMFYDFRDKNNSERLELDDFLLQYENMKQNLSKQIVNWGCIE